MSGGLGLVGVEPYPKHARRGESGAVDELFDFTDTVSDRGFS